MARSIVITSGKGGVGKTTLTANLGRALALMGKRVVLLDTDLGLNNLDVTMNIENKVVYDLIDVIENRCRAKQALIEDDLVKGLYIMPSAHTYEQSAVNGQNIRSVIFTLKNYFDFVIIDCPAGIETGFHRAVAASNEAIVVTTPHLSAIKDAGRAINLIRDYQLGVSLVLNRVRGDLIMSSDMVSVADVAKLLRIETLGVIPEDDAYNQIINTGKLKLNSEAFEATKMLAKNLVYGTNTTTGYEGYYLYDIKENSIQRYDTALLDKVTAEKDKYLTMVIVLSCVCFLSMLFLLIEVNKYNKIKNEN